MPQRVGTKRGRNYKGRSGPRPPGAFVGTIPVGAPCPPNGDCGLGKICKIDIEGGGESVCVVELAYPFPSF